MNNNITVTANNDWLNKPVKDIYNPPVVNLPKSNIDINAFNQQMVQGVKDPAITLAGTVPPANIPPTGNTNSPKDTTGGVDLSGYMGSTAGDIYKGAVDYYGAEANKTVDEAEIRRRNLADMQAEIDATNALYASKLARAQQEGSGRLGQSTAIQGRRGLLGSDFGAAQTQVVQGANEDIYSSIDQEKNARIQQLMTKARENAAAEIEKRTAAKTAGVKEYVTYLSGQTTQREANVKNLIDSLVNGGIDVNGLPKEGENSIAKLAESYGVTANKLKQDYINAKKAADTALAKQKAEDEKASRLTVGEGQRVYQYDPKTGAYSQVAYNPKTYKATGGGTGAGATTVGGVPGNSPAQSWLSQYNSGAMSLEDIYSKIGSSKTAEVTKNQLASLIAAQGGKRVLTMDDSQVAAIDEQIKNINDLIGENGYNYKVISGPLQGGALGFGGLATGAKGDALAIARNLVSNQTLQSLADAKAKGITFGALSEAELSAVANAASRIASKVIKDEGGQITGFSGSESGFKDDLLKVKEGLENSKRKKTGLTPIGGVAGQVDLADKIINTPSGGGTGGYQFSN